VNVISRGIKNTFRNGLRTLSFSIILAISMGMGFAMLLANQAVHARLNDLRTRIGNTISVHPAGIFGTEGGGKPLTDKEVDALVKLAHVVRVDKSIDFLINNSEASKDKSQDSMSTIESQTSSQMLETNLLSALKPFELGEGVKLPGGRKLPPPPIGASGITGSFDTDGKPLLIASGRALNKDDVYGALVGRTLAEKNNLMIGSTFTIKQKTFTVVGIINSETEFAGNTIKIPFTTAQTLTERNGLVLAALVQIDSIDNLEALKQEIQKVLGKGRADVTSSQPGALQAVASLQSIERISFVALVVALAAGALTVLLTMLIVVRERTKEIGVLKALGAGNGRVILQFMTEATALTMIGTLLGLGIALISGNVILSTLLSSKTGSGNETPGGDSSLGSSVQMIGGGALPQTSNDMLSNLVTFVDWHLIVYGLIAALGIALIGSALPAWLVARVRPAKVMRGN
jgi:putative ABC transport system permease protein